MRSREQPRPVGLAGLAAAAVLGGALCGAVQSAVPAADPGPQEDIRDIRLPRMQGALWLWVALAGGGALAGLAGHLLWRRHRRRPTLAATPYEQALRGLEATRDLMRPAQSEQFTVALSGILRTYVEQAFHVTTIHRTTEEFLRDLVHSSNAALVLHRAQLADFLRQCDLVKFAGTSLSPEAMESLYRSALAFVRETGAPSHDPVPAA
jgi:hypothetical protein